MPDAENSKLFDPTLEATSETIIHPTLETTSEVIIDTAANIDGQAADGLSYERADGTIERASTNLEAIARCPYLGKLPMEQANVLLELSRAGKAMMAERKIQAELNSVKTKEEIPPTVTAESEPNTTKHTEVDNTTTMVEVADPAIRHLESIQDIPHIISKETQLQDAIDIATKHLRIKPKLKLVDQKLEQKSAVIIPIKETTLPKLNKPVIKFTAEPINIRPTKVSRQSTMLDIDHGTINSDDDVEDSSIKLIVNEKLSSHVEIQPTIVTELLVVTEATADFVKSELIPDAPTTEQDYADEAVITFNQLLELVPIDDTEISETLQTSEIILTEIDNSDEVETEEITTGNIFENFVLIQTEGEIIADIDTIAELANQQPIEDSLLQLISLIRSAPIANKSTMIMVNQLTGSFRTIVSSPESKSEPKDLTPEMIQNILALLRLIGYEEPALTLIDFVAQHDLEFLISAMCYLEQLTNPDNRHEFLSTHIFAPIYGTIIHPMAHCIGETVMKLNNHKLRNLLTSI